MTALPKCWDRGFCSVCGGETVHVRALATGPLGGVPEQGLREPLVRADDPILRKRARELTDRERAHNKVAGLISRLFAVMAARNGAGLAAPQIGESLRVFVMGEESFVNPVITERSAETIVYEEGCLSLPGILVDVRRNVSITVQTAGRIVRLTGTSARVAQHEIDHLDGKLITDYALERPRPALPAPAECEIEAIAALLTSTVSLIGGWRERAQWLFARGVRIQEVGGPSQGPRGGALAEDTGNRTPVAALPAPEPPPFDYAAAGRPHPFTPREDVPSTCSVCGRYESAPHVAPVGAALPAEHAPPDATDLGLLSRAIELLMANDREYAPNNAATDWYLRDQRVLALLREVTTRGRPEGPSAPVVKALSEMRRKANALEDSMESRSSGFRSPDDTVKACVARAYRDAAELFGQALAVDFGSRTPEGT